jgi:glutathione S-transferase
VLELADGTCISECTAITEYVDNLVGEPVLTGRNARDRAIIHMMQRRTEAGLLDAAATYFHHATPGLGPKIEIYQNREWGEKNRKSAIAGMRYLDQVLARQPFLAGDHFTMADITAFAGLVYAAIATIEVPGELSNLTFWHQRVASRPSIAHA